jgi:predicted RNA binding protein YcfA (HicA-like mRNA interferase family)
MSRWPSTRSHQVLTGLLRIGWTIKRQSGTSHRVLTRPGWPDYVFAFHDREEIGPKITINKIWAGNKGKMRIAIWVILLSFFVSPFFCFAKEIYRWTDEKGDVHLTDDFSKIPPQYQNQVEKTEVNEEASGADKKQDGKASKPSVKTKAKPDRTKEDLEAYEKKIKQKKSIEGKIEKLGEELKSTEKELEEIKDSMVRDRKRDSKEEKLRLKIRDIKKQIADLEKQLSKIKKGL